MLKFAVRFYTSISRQLFNTWKKVSNFTRKTKKALNNRFLRLSHGNKKLHRTLTTYFVVWNLPAKVTCPYATEACKGACYACKAEKVYPDVLPARYDNLEKSKSASFVSDMIETLKFEYASNARVLGNKQMVVRIHESGDFYDKEYAMKWLEIARYFENMNVVFMAYTKSLPFFRGENIPENFIIRASVWCDTQTDLELESYENYPVYTAYTDEEINAMKETINFQEVENTTSSGCEWLVCRCSDCGSCNACWNRNFKNIVCAIH